MVVMNGRHENTCQKLNPTRQMKRTMMLLLTIRTGPCTPPSLRPDTPSTNPSPANRIQVHNSGITEADTAQNCAALNLNAHPPEETQSKLFGHNSDKFIFLNLNLPLFAEQGLHVGQESRITRFSHLNCGCVVRKIKWC